MKFRDPIKFRFNIANRPWLAAVSGSDKPSADANDRTTNVKNEFCCQLDCRSVIEQAIKFLPNDGTEWLPRLLDAQSRLACSWLVGDAANVPSKVAEYAFESMGYQYMQVENGEWRDILGRIAWRQWSLSRGQQVDNELDSLLSRLDKLAQRSGCGESDNGRGLHHDSSKS